MYSDEIPSGVISLVFGCEQAVAFTQMCVEDGLDY